MSTYLPLGQHLLILAVYVSMGVGIGCSSTFSETHQAYFLDEADVSIIVTCPGEPKFKCPGFTQ